MHQDRRIKFRHLDAFSAIARAGSLKRAAEAMNLTQPAISKTLKELEEIAGTSLMERNRAGVSLTPDGEVFLQFAEQSLAAMRQGLNSIRSQAVAAGRLRIGVLPSVASSLAPRAVAAFTRAHPAILLELHEGPHQDLTARLRSGGLDLVIGRLGNPESMVGLIFRQLYTEEVVVVAAPDSPARWVRRFAALEAYRVLYPPKDSAIRELVARHLIALGVPLFANRIETASAAFGRAVTCADPGTVWVISRGVVAGDLAEGRLVELDLDTAPTAGAVGIMSRAEDIPSAAQRGFVQALTGLVAQGVDGV